MKVLVVGSGGREHALCWAAARSPTLEKLYCAPGNAGTAGLAEGVPIRAEDVGHGEIQAGDPADDEQVEVVQRSGVQPQAHAAGGKVGSGNIDNLYLLGAAVPVDDRRLHGQLRTALPPGKPTRRRTPDGRGR